MNKALLKSIFNLQFGLAVSVICVLGSHSSLAAVGLSIFPASITNDYSGQVTLAITGLTNNQPVHVKRFYDVNGNGTIDVGQDFAIQSFKVTDGQLPLIGGVRDLNVAGDDDGAANGQIQTILDHPGLSDVVGGATGKFVFKLEDPQSGAGLATRVFSVAQKVEMQGVRGRVTSAATSLPLANTVVALVADAPGVVIGLTDADGNYSFYTPTGEYAVLVVCSNYVSHDDAGFVTVPSNQFVTKNLALASSTYTISGRVTDISNGKPLGAIFVNCEAENSFLGTFTDTNGNYSFSVTPGQWEINVDRGSLAQRGYLTPEENSELTVFANVSNVNFALSRATALIFGTVKDGFGNPVSGISMAANDGNYMYRAVGLCNANGAYTLGVMAGNWNASPDEDTLAAKGYSVDHRTNVAVSINQAVQADFILQEISTHLRGQIKDNYGNPIANIGLAVQPYAVQDGGSATLYPRTDESGNFEVGVTGGMWTIALECEDAQDRGYVNISGLVYNAVDGVDQNGLVLTFPQSTALITGRLTDAGGNPIAGVTLDASQFINMNSSYHPGCVSTDTNGYYQLRVLNGTWSVSVRNDELIGLGYDHVPSTNVTISGGNVTANFVAQHTLTAPKFTGGGFSPSNGASLTFQGIVFRNNTIQVSTNLVNWVVLTNIVPTNATCQFFDPSVANYKYRFYRVVVAP